MAKRAAGAHRNQCDQVWGLRRTGCGLRDHVIRSLSDHQNPPAREAEGSVSHQDMPVLPRSDSGGCHAVPGLHLAGRIGGRDIQAMNSTAFFIETRSMTLRGTCALRIKLTARAMARMSPAPFPELLLRIRRSLPSFRISFTASSDRSSSGCSVRPA